MLFPHLGIFWRSSWKELRSMPEIYLRNGNLVSIVRKHTQQREIWCIRDNTDYHIPVIIYQLDSTKHTLNELYSQIYAKANVTLYNFNLCSPIDRYVEIKFLTLDQTNQGATIIQTEFEGYQFLTCYGVPYITLNFYLSPFQLELWAALGTTIFTIAALTIGAQHFSSLLEQQPFSAWMYVLASLFEESGFMLRRIEKQSFFRILLGIWSLIALVLTNAYIGIMVSELNLPMRQNHPELFDQLVCDNRYKNLFTSPNLDNTKRSRSAQMKTEYDQAIWLFQYAKYYWNLHLLSLSMPLKSYHDAVKYATNESKVDASCFQLLSKINDLQSLPVFFSALLNLADRYLSNDIHYRSVELNLMLSTKHAFLSAGFNYLNENLTNLDIQGGIESEVVKCGKTVFIGKSSDIIIEHDYLSRKSPP
ncbi:Glutamate receptor 3.4 [Folsomia candida]|uniref:Glutamate receptor 3.4 n=1 Tax=Folsomia candida TaxID=158441 RepID=A0A226DQG1_FOLCA|nr:Glutamate receptor 3.4 [Folsomia candida]